MAEQAPVPRQWTVNPPPEQVWTCRSLDCKESQQNEARVAGGRKCVSDFFGRNKAATLRIPEDVWNWLCRRCYQRGHYQSNLAHGVKEDTLPGCVWQLQAVRDQLLSLRLYRPGAHFDIQLQVAAEVRYKDFCVELTKNGGNRVAAEAAVTRPSQPRSSRGARDVDDRRNGLRMHHAEYLINYCIGPNKTYSDIDAILAWIEQGVRAHQMQCLPPIEFLIHPQQPGEPSTLAYENPDRWFAHKTGRPFDPVACKTRQDIFAPRQAAALQKLLQKQADDKAKKAAKAGQQSAMVPGPFSSTATAGNSTAATSADATASGSGSSSEPQSESAGEGSQVPRRPLNRSAKSVARARLTEQYSQPVPALRTTHQARRRKSATSGLNVTDAVNPNIQSTSTSTVEATVGPTNLPSFQTAFGPASQSAGQHAAPFAAGPAAQAIGQPVTEPTIQPTAVPTTHAPPAQDEYRAFNPLPHEGTAPHPRQLPAPLQRDAKTGWMIGPFRGLDDYNRAANLQPADAMTVRLLLRLCNGEPLEQEPHVNNTAFTPSSVAAPQTDPNEASEDECNMDCEMEANEDEETEYESEDEEETEEEEEEETEVESEDEGNTYPNQRRRIW